MLPNTFPEFPVITICGSMRYYDQMIGAAQALTANGWIVLCPFVADYANGIASDAQKEMLDAMHFAKIEMASAILVIGIHRGMSTIKEIGYAESAGKLVFTTIDGAIQFVTHSRKVS
jgi:hypothetical protein